MSGSRYPLGVFPRSSSSTNRRTLLAGCTALAVGLAGCSGLGESYSIPADLGVRSDWPHQFHDPGNTNAAPDGPDSLTERWSRRVEARLDRPLVLEGTVLTVATDRGDTVHSRVLAYDADTGDREWRYELDGLRRARIVAAVGDRVYVVGDRTDAAGEQRLCAVGTDGSIAWRFDAERITAVAVTEATVFASVRHGSVVAIDGSGETVGRLHPVGWPGGRWLSDRTPTGRPAVSGGRVFVPFARYDADRENSYFQTEVVAFDTNGVAWRSAVGDVRYVEGVAALGESVYVLAVDQRGGPSEPRVVSLTVLDAASGERRWTRSVEGGLSSPLAVREEGVTVVGSDVRTFDPDGQLRWREAVFSGAPVVAGDRAYGRRTESGAVDTVVAADLETGEPTAAHTFEHQLNRAPVFADGRAIARTLEYDRTGEGAEHAADRLHMLR
nr:PQQ-binding-like beta-propeller repeat protein [Natronomonas aquatica]